VARGRLRTQSVRLRLRRGGERRELDVAGVVGTSQSLYNPYSYIRIIKGQNCVTKLLLMDMKAVFGVVLSHLANVLPGGVRCDISTADKIIL
jgi:hypothetical protein